MSDEQRYAWFDGEIRPLDEIRVSPLSHFLHYGTGVFEGIRANMDPVAGNHQLSQYWITPIP